MKKAEIKRQFSGVASCNSNCNCNTKHMKDMILMLEKTIKISALQRSMWNNKTEQNRT